MDKVEADPAGEILPSVLIAEGHGSHYLLPCGVCRCLILILYTCLINAIRRNHVGQHRKAPSLTYCRLFQQSSWRQHPLLRTRALATTIVLCPTMPLIQPRPSVKSGNKYHARACRAAKARIDAKIHALAVVVCARACR